MASESESEKRETSADIADEIRRAVESMGDELPYTVSAGTMRRVADRIEAARRLEEKTYLDQIRDAMNMWGHEKHIAEHAKKPTVGNAAAMREAVEAALAELDKFGQCHDARLHFADIVHIDHARGVLQSALSAPPRKGRWENGNRFEYEYAYCSECGRMQWAGWDTHKQAEENIELFAHDYKFCPGCGSEMEGGVYVK